MFRAVMRAGGATSIVMAMVLALSGAAAAHEERKVGRFHLAVGFGDEPAYAGQKNSVQVLLSDATSDTPVLDLGSTLQVQVAYGSQNMPAITMEPDFEIGESGTPGDYRGWFIPSRPGSYSFHFTGSIHGQKIDTTFKSGPSTFSNVEDPQSVEFPAKDPTTGQLNDLLTRETGRIRTDIAAARSDASSDATTARNLALIAVALAAVALVIAMTSRRKSK
jgi:hypothetical protein